MSKIKIFYISFILIVNTLLLSSCDLWMKPMKPFIIDALSATVTFIHSDNEKFIIETYLNKKITRPDIKISGYSINNWYNDPSLKKEWIFETDIVYDKNITLYGKMTFDGSLKIGDTGPSGGTIFYISSEGFTVQMENPANNYKAHYLEVASINVSDNMSWCGCSSGCLVSGVTNLLAVNGSIGADGPNQAILDTIGQGRRDTALIVAYHTSDTLLNNAAIACNQYTVGESDWFLPSIGELRLYYDSTATKPENGIFWSSSQSTNMGNALRLNFNGGGLGNYSKPNDSPVRPIRAF